MKGATATIRPARLRRGEAAALRHDVPMETSAEPSDAVRRLSDSEAARSSLRWLLGFGLGGHVLGWAFIFSAGDTRQGLFAAGSEDYGTLVYGWLLMVAGGCGLVVALIGYGVALGVRAARDDTAQPAA